MSFTSTFLVEIDGRPLPADVAPLLTSALVDDSQRFPDLFELRFRDPAHLVLTKTGAKVGSAVRVSVSTSDSQAPVPLMTGEVTALQSEFDSGGVFVVLRGYDAAHRLFRGRRTEAYTQMTASDIAVKVAQRAGLPQGEVTSTTTVYEHVPQAGTSDWDLMQRLAADVGFEVTVREGKFGFAPPTSASGAPPPGGAEAKNPLVLKLGADLLRFRAVVTSADQVKEVEVRGWDTATKQPLTATRPATTTSVVLPDARPADLAAAFGEAARYVSTDVPHRTQAEVDVAASALAEAVSGVFAEFEGVARGNPEVRAGAAITVDGLGSPFDGKYTVTTSRHRLDPSSGYTTSFSVTGVRDRTLLGLTADGGLPATAPPGAVIAVVDDVNDPERTGRVRLRFPWLDGEYVSGWARTVQSGAGKDRGALVLPEVDDEVLVVFEQADFRRPYVLGGLYNGVDQPSAQGIPVVDSGKGTVNRRSWVSRRGHRVDLLDEDGRTEGVSLAAGTGAVSLLLDATGTKVTVHSDGSVLIEGTRGITLDAASAPLELKGGKVTISATQGVTVDGGAGPVGVTGSQLDLAGKATASLTAALVKIN
ncbi:MAG: VgrG-related protein [Nocardioidaceae bacterium]|nr:VgrG-related protein [Nocardioidaceae bacterium]